MWAGFGFHVQALPRRAGKETRPRKCHAGIISYMQIDTEEYSCSRKSSMQSIACIGIWKNVSRELEQLGGKFEIAQYPVCMPSQPAVAAQWNKVSDLHVVILHVMTAY